MEARYGRTAILREAPSLPSPASQGDRKLIVGLAKRGPRACYAGMAPTRACPVAALDVARADHRRAEIEHLGRALPELQTLCSTAIALPASAEE